jgi:hypothetical protein
MLCLIIYRVLVWISWSALRTGGRRNSGSSRFGVCMQRHWVEVSSVKKGRKSFLNGLIWELLSTTQEFDVTLPNWSGCIVVRPAQCGGRCSEIYWCSPRCAVYFRISPRRPHLAPERRSTWNGSFRKRRDIFEPHLDFSNQYLVTKITFLLIHCMLCRIIDCGSLIPPVSGDC